MRIIVSNFAAVSSIKDLGELLYTVQEIINHTGLTEEDLYQQIYMSILEILVNYKNTGMSFLQVVSWLLPRKM